MRFLGIEFRLERHQFSQILMALKGCREDGGHEHPQARLILVKVVDLATKLELTGDIRTMKITEDQICTIEWGKPVDRRGHPAKVEEGSVKIECSDDSVTIEQDPANPFKATLTGVHGNEETGAVITIKADADLGEGVAEITGTEPLVVTEGPAVGFGAATIGTPTQQP